MPGLPTTGSLDPATLLAVGGVIVALAGGLLTIIGVLWRGFVWLDRRMDARIDGWSASKGFKSAVAEVVTAAFAPAVDYQNRLHEEHRRAVAELRKRDDERAEAVKRLHQRMDDLMGRVAAK